MPDFPDDHRGARALRRMVEYAPSSGGLALWVRHQDMDAAGTAPLHTDGHCVFYGPAFERLPLAEQTGWVAHEVLHIALRHVQRHAELQQRLGDVSLPVYNLCADAIVNSALGHLRWLALPREAITLERLLAHTMGLEQPVEAALLQWDVERLYRALDDRPERALAGDTASGPTRSDTSSRDATRAERRGQRWQRALSLLGAAQADLQPGGESRIAPEAEAELTREWRERLQRAHAGDGEFSMLRALLADLPASRTPWEQVLRTRLTRGLSQRPGLSWSRPSRSYLANHGRTAGGRRLPWEPGRSATTAAPRLVLIVDVSASIDDALLQRFVREVEALTRRLEAAVSLVIGDDRVRSVMHFAPGQAALRELQVQGGGATDFTPLLQAADALHPDIGVVLTDLEGPAKFQPRWPLLWAVPEAQRDAVPPFGRLLVLR